MSVPIATTTIDVIRSSDHDPYDASGVTTTTPATGVRAHISKPTGNAQIVGGDQSVTSFELNCDPCDLKYSDIVHDNGSGEDYIVLWSRLRPGLGLDHIEAGLRFVEGNA